MYRDGTHVRVKPVGDIGPGDDWYRGCAGRVDAALTGLGGAPYVAVRPDDPKDGGTFGVLMFHPESLEIIQ